MSATILSAFYDVDMLYKVILNFTFTFHTTSSFVKGPKRSDKTLLRPSSRISHVRS